MGATGGFVAGTYLDAPLATRCIMGAVGAFGGLLPDADTKSSILGRLLPNWWHKLTPGHRGITHSFLYCAVVFGLSFWLVAAIQPWGQSVGLWGILEYPYLPIALTAGMLTHLFADGLTVQGVPFFYPFTKRKLKLLGPLSFKTGSGVEPIVVKILISVAVAYVLMPFTDKIVDMLDTPLDYGIRTDVVIVFIAIVILSIFGLTVYSYGTSPTFKRRWSKMARR